jgi:hypothetical protein
MTFNPNEHLMQIKNRNGSSDYLPVQWRLVWFRLECPNGTIETETIHLDPDKETEEETFVWNNETRRSEKVIKAARGLAIVRATVRDGKGGVAMGTKMEKAASFGDWLEKAETGAIGRALAALGYGTQFTGDEFDERHRIVDSPVDRGASIADVESSNGNEQVPATTTNTPQSAPVASKPVDKPAQAPARTYTVSQLRTLAAKHVGPNAFNAIVGILQPIYKNLNLQVDGAWQDKQCQHAYALLKKQIDEKKPLSQAS